MASSIINSDDGVISGTSGLKTTGGDDGVLKIQNNGVDAITVADDGEVTFAAGLSIASPIVFPAGTASLPAITTTGDLNTGIYFPAADTIGFAEGGTQVGEFDSSANFKFNSGYGSVATAYGCRAWVNFDGFNTPSISGSGNISTIGDLATGRYTINFSTAMPDANYGVAGAAQSQSSGYIVHIYAINSDPSPLTTTSFPIQVRADSGSANDSTTVCVSVFR